MTDFFAEQQTNGRTHYGAWASALLGGRVMRRLPAIKALYPLKGRMSAIGDGSDQADFALPVERHSLSCQVDSGNSLPDTSCRCHDAASLKGDSAIRADKFRGSRTMMVRAAGHACGNQTN